MGLFDAALAEGRDWIRVGDAYEITKKPRGLDWSSVQAIPFAPMDAIPQTGEFAAQFSMRTRAELTSGTYFERGDLLVAKITPSFENGKQALATNLPASFGYATTEVIPLRPRNRGHDPRFLFYYLLHPDVRHYVAERMEGSTGRQRVPDEALLDLPIPRFDPGEQTQVAEALGVLRDAAKQESMCESAASGLKQAVTRDLFTRGLRGGQQKESDIGAVPESWDVVTFEQVREWLQYGTSERCSPEPAEYPVLRIPNVGAGSVNYDDLKFCDLPSSVAEKYLLEEGDLLFIRTNGVLERLGSCAVFRGRPERALFASYLIRARLKVGVDPRFIAYFFGSERGTALVSGRATPAADGKYNLNTGTIDSLPVPLPPTEDEQREIVAILDAIDRKIDVHRRKRVLLDDLFKALLHKLLIGEVRVAELDLSVLPAPNEARP